MIAVDDKSALKAALLTALINADDLIEMGTLIAMVTRWIDPASRSQPNLPLQNALKSAFWSLKRADVIVVREIDDIVDDHVVFEEGFEKDKAIAFTDAYMVSLGPAYPVFVEDHAPLVLEVAAKAGLSLNDNLRNLLDGKTLIPAADRIIDLDHNAAAVAEVISRLDVASEAIRTSNVLDSSVRQALRDQIHVGIELLKKPKVYLTAITGLLLKPLYDAYCAIAEGAARTAIEVAVSALRHLIGL